MKKIILGTLLFVVATSFGQTNEKGTLQFNAGAGAHFMAGLTLYEGVEDIVVTSLGAGWNLSSQVGLSDNMSIGLKYKSANTVVAGVPTFDDLGDADYDNGSLFKYSVIKLESKHYLGNGDVGNFYFSPGFGLASFKYNDIGADGSDFEKNNGINIGLALGGAWYFGESNFGMFTEIEIEQNYLNNKEDNKAAINPGFIGLNLGLSVKI